MKKIYKLTGAILLIISLLVLQLPSKEADAAASVSDFSIEGTTLVAYVGSDSNVTIPSSVQTIGTDAFANNKYVTAVILPDSVTEIEEYAFWNCRNLSYVSIGEGLEEIGDFAFANCKGLTNVVIPRNVHTIGIYSFQDDVNLTDITIPAQTYSIHESSFDGCYKLTIHAVEGSFAYNYAKDFEKKKELMPEYQDIPTYEELYDELPVSTIPSTDTEQVQTPDSLPESTGDAISQVHIVANSAVFFMDNSSPNVIHGNDGLGYLLPSTGENQTFTSTPDSLLPKYAVVDNRIIADQAFYKREDLEKIVLPDTIEEIGEFSYARSSVVSLVLPKELKSISYAAFYHCDSLENVELPSSVTSVSPQAFSYTKFVKDFYADSEADDYLISGGVLLAYKGSSAEVQLPDAVRVIAGGVFDGHTEIQRVVCPDSLLYIGEEAFWGCTNLTECDLPRNIIGIKDRAFANTGLSQVDIPESLQYMGYMVFPGSCNVHTNGTGWIRTCEPSTNRLSGLEKRFDPDEINDLGNNKGLTFTGIDYGKADLEGASMDYTLIMEEVPTDEMLINAVNRAASFLPQTVLDAAASRVFYHLQLSDSSKQPITKLGKQTCTIAIPAADSLLGKKESVFGLDRNGQLISIPSEQVKVGEVTYLRMQLNTISDLVIFGTEGGRLVVKEEAFALPEYMMPLPSIEETEPSFRESFAAWAQNKGIRIPIFLLTFLSGMYLLVLKRFKQ